MPLAVKTRLMCGSLDLARSSHGQRRLSASAFASASGLGRAHGPNPGPLPSVGGRGDMGHRGPPRWNLACCWGGRPGLGAPLARLAEGGGPAGFGGALLARHGARQAARRARTAAERRAAGLGRRLRGDWAEWEARE